MPTRDEEVVSTASGTGSTSGDTGGSTGGGSPTPGYTISLSTINIQENEGTRNYTIALNRINCLNYSSQYRFGLLTA